MESTWCFKRCVHPFLIKNILKIEHYSLLRHFYKIAKILTLVR